MITKSVKRLAEQALAILPKPYSEDVIEDVFCALEQNKVWRREYDELCVDLTKIVVNNWVGVWVSRYVGLSGVQQVASKKSSLVGAYSKLTSRLVKPGGKRKEPEALQLMSDYYHTHKSELRANIQKYRNPIIELLIEGVSPDEAFAAVRILNGRNLS